MKYFLSIIIPTRNEEMNIARCLENLKLATGNRKLASEIIVVDNYSTDKTYQIAKKYTKNVFVCGGERSCQRNFGAKKSQGKYLLFLDADMTLAKNYYKKIAIAVKLSPKVDAFIIPEKTVGENYWAKVRALERSCYLGEPTIEAARFFERKAFLKIGGYDKILVSGEDWDLTERFREIGPIGRVKSRIIHHEDNFSLLNHLKKKSYYAKKIRTYAKKHPKTYSQQSGIKRLKIFVKNRKKLLKDPVHGFGLSILKSLEYFTYCLIKK